MQNRTTIKVAIGVTIAALLALLGYSLERSAWLFGRFEIDPTLPIAAAVVVELAAVALIAGAGAIAQLDAAARAWANRALVAVLSVQALANLSAGYLRGGRATLALFGSADDLAAYGVAAALWFVTNLSVPALVLCLSKLLERLVSALAALPVESTDQQEQTQPVVLRPALAHAADAETDAETSYATARIHAHPESIPPHTPDTIYACDQCGAWLTRPQWLAARRWGHCPSCKSPA